MFEPFLPISLDGLSGNPSCNDPNHKPPAGKKQPLMGWWICPTCGRHTLVGSTIKTIAGSLVTITGKLN